MEDKLSSKVSHVWTLSDFIERRKDWDQGDEARLAEYLQQLSNKITQGAKNTLNELDDLVANIDDTAIQVANINNEFQLLADKQFIENKVQEEDETVQNKIEKPVICEINDADLLVNNIKEALRNSFKAIDSHFEKITVVVSDSDDDDADDEFKHEEIVLRPKIFYKKLNLPLLSGNIQSEMTIDNMSSDSDIEPPMDTFKDQESFSINDESEEDTHSLNESKSVVEPNHQTVDTQINVIESEHFEPKIVSTDAPYIESDLFCPPPLLNDNDEDDLANEYNIFSNGSNIFGERNLWDDSDDDDINNFEPPLPIYTDEPPQPVIKSNAQEKVPSIQQTLNDELRKRFHKDNVVSSSDNENIDSPKIKLPIGAVNVLGGTNQKTPNTDQNIKQATISQISKNVAEPIQYSDISDVNNDISASNKLFDNSYQNADPSTHKNLKEEIKPIKKQSFFEQESDDEDLFAKKSNNVILFSPDKPKQRENPTNKVKESKTLFSQSDEEFMDSKSTTEKIPSLSIDHKSTKLLDSSSDDDLFNVKSSNYKSIMKKNLDQTEPKLKSQVEDKNDKEILNKKLIDLPKENSTKPCIMDYNEIIEKESIRNNNTLSNVLVPSSTNNKSKKLSYLFSSDEDDDIFFDADESNKNSKKKDHLVSNSTKLEKNRNDKPYGSKVELFDSSSDDEIFNTNKSNNNFTYKKNNKQSVSNKGKNIITSESLVNHCVIKEIPDAKNEKKKNLIGKNVTNKQGTQVFSLESDDDDDDDYSSTNNSDGFKILSDKQNVNDNVKSMSLSSEEYLSPLSERKDVFNDFSVENIFNSKHPESLNEKGIDIPQNETSPNFIENTNEDNRFIFSSSDDEQQLSFNSIIRNVKTNTEIKVIHSTLDSLSWNSPINKNQELPNDQDTPKNETLSNSTENEIQDKNSSIFSSSDNEKQLFLNSNNQNEESNNEIVIRPTLDSLPASLPIIKNEESINKKEIFIAKNETSPSSNQNNIQDKSSIFSSIKDEQQLSYNTNIENKKSVLTKVIGLTSDSKISLQDSVDGSSFSSLNSKNDNTKKLPGKLGINAGAFINIASLLPNSKSQLIKSNSSQSKASDEKNDATLPTSGTKLFSAEKERAKIQVKRRPPSRKARQARMSSIDIDQGSKSENSSHLNISTFHVVNCQSGDTQKEGNSGVINKNQAQSNNKLSVTYDDKINEIGGKSEINNKVKEKGTLDLFNDDSNPFEPIQEDKSRKDFCNDNTEIKIVEKQLESKLLTGQLSDIVVNQKQSAIESGCDKLLKTESKHDKQVNAVNMEGIVGNNSKEITQSTLLPTKSSSLFDEEEDIFSEKSKKVNKLSSNIFDSDDEYEFNHKFTKNNSIKTKSIFGDDSDDDLFSTPSKPTASNLSNQKQIDKLSQRQNRSSTDGYVKLTAESVAINPLAESKNN